METFAQLAGVAVAAAIVIFVPVTYLMPKWSQPGARHSDTKAALSP
jgi:hypothetical protein